MTIATIYRSFRLGFRFTRTLSTVNRKLVNFSPLNSGSDSDSNSDLNSRTLIKKTTTTNNNNLPPPYNPFKNKPPETEKPGPDPTNLQEVFHKIRTEGLFDNAVKMFDGLSKDGLTHEALELFGHIKDKGQMPDVVAYTAVIESYVNANHPKDAHKVFLRMLAAGVLPNAYTYSVLVKGLAMDGGTVGEAKKRLMEMMGKEIRPNAETCVAVVEGLVREKAEEDGRVLVNEINEKGFLPEKKAVSEVLKGKRGPEVRRVMSLLFGE